jgi:hypothetical protein
MAGQSPAPLPHLGLVFDATTLLTTDAGTFTLSGQTVTLRHGHKLALAAGSFTLSGQDITLTAPAVNSVGSPAFLPHIGLNMDLVAGTYALALGKGTFTLSGQALATPTGYSLPLATGSFVWTGAPADADYEINLDAGSFAVTGVAAVVTKTYTTLDLAAGSFTLTGQQVGTAYEQVGGLTAPLNTGPFVLSGQALTMSLTRRLALDAGSFTLTGKAVSFDSLLWVKIDPASSTWSAVTPEETEWAEAA